MSLKLSGAIPEFFTVDELSKPVKNIRDPERGVN